MLLAPFAAAAAAAAVRAPVGDATGPRRIPLVCNYCCALDAIRAAVVAALLAVHCVWPCAVCRAVIASALQALRSPFADASLQKEPLPIYILAVRFSLQPISRFLFPGCIISY